MNERDFGLKVKARREELNLSQQDLANLMGLDQGKVSLIERGARKIDSVIELPMLAKALKCPLSWFYESDSLSQDAKELDPIDPFLEQFFDSYEFDNDTKKKLSKFLIGVVSSYLDINPSLYDKVMKSDSKARRREQNAA